MTFLSADVAIVVVNGVDISAYCTSAKLDRKPKTERHELLGNAGIATIVHTNVDTLSLEGLITPEIEAVLPANLGALASLGTTQGLVTIEYGPQGNASGALKRIGNARVLEYMENTKGGGTGTFTSSLGIDGILTDTLY